MDTLIDAIALSARVIGQQKDCGALESGMRADFLVQDANPLDDIRHTARLTAVWRGGQQVPSAKP